MTSPQRDTANSHRNQMIALLRRYASIHHRYGRVFARSMGLHATDAEALLAISEAEMRGEPMTPARLATWIPLSSGATATLLNRLEGHGYVVRSREHDDRRVVTLRTGAHVAARAEQFFAPLGSRLDGLLDRHSPAQLEEFESFLDQLTTTMTEHLEDSDAEPPPASQPPL